MKRITFVSIILLASMTASLAQTDFQTEFEASRQLFIDNPARWFQTDCTPNFQYITAKGIIASLEQLSQQFTTKKVLQRDFSGLTFRALDNVMIVTGYLTHKYLQQTDSSIIDYGKETITYTFMKENGRWKAASAHHSSSAPAFTEATFKSLIDRYEKDPIAFFSNDCTRNLSGIDVKGKSVSSDQIKAIYKNLHCEKEVFDQLQIRHYGNTGIATGHLTSYFRRNDGQTFTQKIVFTHYYTFLNGAWKMAGFQHTNPSSSLSAKSDE